MLANAKVRKHILSYTVICSRMLPHVSRCNAKIWEWQRPSSTSGGRFSREGKTLPPGIQVRGSGGEGKVGRSGGRAKPTTKKTKKSREI